MNNDLVQLSQADGILAVLPSIIRRVNAPQSAVASGASLPRLRNREGDAVQAAGILAAVEPLCGLGSKEFGERVSRARLISPRSFETHSDAGI